MIGLSLTEAMAALLPQAEADEHAALAETYKSCFQQARLEGRVEEPLFDGVLDLLDHFEREGWLLAVATGKSDRGLRHCLESHGIHARFVSLQTADRHPSKPAPGMALAAIAEAGATPERSIVVGDTAFDMGMACAAGAFGIGAAWGYHSTEELLAAGAFAVAQSPGEVAAIAAARNGDGQWLTKRSGSGASPSSRCCAWRASRSSSSASPSLIPTCCARAAGRCLAGCIAISGLDRLRSLRRELIEEGVGSRGFGRPPLVKRFWTEAQIAERDGGWTVELDGKPLRTPARAPLSGAHRRFGRSHRRRMERRRRDGRSRGRCR